MKLKTYIVKNDETLMISTIKRKNIRRARRDYPGDKYTIYGPYDSPGDTRYAHDFRNLAMRGTLIC